LCAAALVFGSLCWQTIVSPNHQGSLDDPATLDEFQLVFRGKMSRERGLRPLRIARMDNNGEILISCLEPATADRLRTHGITFLPSQLELLVDWNLLEYDAKHKTYATTIHVYGSQKASAVRRMVEAAVKQLAGELEPDLESLRNHLRKTDHEKSMFAVLYAYVLHAFSMEQFGKKIYQDPQLSSESPFWNGYGWAIYPIRKFAAANTFFPMDGSRLFVVSAEAVSGPNFQELLAFVKEYSTDQRLENPGTIKAFHGFGVCDDEGKLAVPIFEPVWTLRLEQMAAKVYEQTVELAVSEPMRDILGMDTQAQASMFLHYEIRHAFMGELLDTGLFQAPVDFRDPEKNRAHDVKNLVFILKNPESR
jgi:hypothetical protein